MFLKKFDYSIEMQKMKRKYSDNLMYYGLVGEEKVSYQLHKLNNQAICLYNIRLLIENQKAQFDFIVICKEKIFIIEVKNLIGNLLITKDYKFKRIIYKENRIQKASMDNPFIQMDNQLKLLKMFLKGYNVKMESILVMANDKMMITNYSDNQNVIKHDEIIKFISDKISIGDISNEQFEIANYILKKDKQYNYFILNLIKDNIKHQYTPKFDNYIDLDIYVKILEFRKEYSRSRSIPVCNVFNNKEAEMLVIAKPINREEFLKVKGFKEKRYVMFGEEIIKIFKKYK